MFFAKKFPTEVRAVAVFRIVVELADDRDVEITRPPLEALDGVVGHDEDVPGTVGLSLVEVDGVERVDLALLERRVSVLRHRIRAAVRVVLMRRLIFPLRDASVRLHDARSDVALEPQDETGHVRGVERRGAVVGRPVVGRPVVGRRAVIGRRAVVRRGPVVTGRPAVVAGIGDRR